MNLDYYFFKLLRYGCNKTRLQLVPKCQRMASKTTTILKAVIILIVLTDRTVLGDSDGAINSQLVNEDPIVSDLGCDLDPDGSAIRCKHSALDHIARAVSVLVPNIIPPPVNVSAPGGGNMPQRSGIIEVDIAECDVQTLPNLFARFNASLERIRVAHSQLLFVAVNAFTGLEHRLRYLDLSGNLLKNVPSAVHLLVALEVLDLRDNHIQFVSDTTGGIPFRNAKSFRELHLAVNVLGMGDAMGGGTVLGPGLSSLPTKQVHRLTLDETVFDLGPAAKTVEFLDLSDNGLLAIPDQLQTSYPRLRTLNMGNNKISDFPAAQFSALENLQSLTLDSNLIRTLKFSSLPSNLKLFSLQDNPLQCDCGIMWLLDLVRRNSSLTLQLPPCNTPFYLRDITISHLNDDRLCHHGLDSDAEVHAVYVTDRDLASFHLGLFQALHLLDVEAEVGSLFVLWKVDPEFYAANLNWSIIVRRQAGGIYNFNTTQFTLENYRRQQPNWQPGEGIYSDSIRNISSAEGYVVCMAAVDNSVYYIHLNHCRGATTLRENPIKVPIIATPAIEILTTTPTSTENDLLSACNKSINLADKKIDYSFNGKVSTRTINLTWTIVTPADEIRSIASLTDPFASNQHSPLALDTLFIRREYRWKLDVRAFASSKQKVTTVTQPEVDDNLQQSYVVTELAPATGYIVCFSLESLPGMSSSKRDHEDIIEKVAKRKCLEFVTEPEYVFPVATVATAIVIATTLTAVIMSLVCCCLPRRYFKGERLGAPIMDEDEESEKEGIINPGFLRSHARPAGLQPVVRGNDAMRPRGSLGQLPPAVVRVMEQKRQQLLQQFNMVEDSGIEEMDNLDDSDRANDNSSQITNMGEPIDRFEQTNELVIAADVQPITVEAVIINSEDVKYIRDAESMSLNHDVTDNEISKVPEEIDLKCDTKSSVDCNDNTLSSEQWLTPSINEQIETHERT